MSTTKETKETRVCVKVSYLRKLGCESFKEWLNDKNNVYVGRYGRIFIGKGDVRKIFHYTGSKFANPFTVKQYGRDKALQLYTDHIKDKDFSELIGKNLGCFCDMNEKCHIDVLLDLLNK